MGSGSVIGNDDVVVESGRVTGDGNGVTGPTKGEDVVTGSGSVTGRVGVVITTDSVGTTGVVVGRFSSPPEMIPGWPPSAEASASMQMYSMLPPEESGMQTAGSGQQRVVPTQG